MGFLNSVEQLRGALDFHMARHNVLTANLAHLDTPRYTPLDLVRGLPGQGFQAVMDGATGAAVSGTATDPESLAARGWQVRADRDPAGSDGNGVSLDSESVKIADNQLRYDVIAQLASTELASLSWAANDGKNG